MESGFLMFSSFWSQSGITLVIFLRFAPKMKRSASQVIWPNFVYVHVFYKKVGNWQKKMKIPKNGQKFVIKDWLLPREQTLFIKKVFAPKMPKGSKDFKNVWPY